MKNTSSPPWVFLGKGVPKIYSKFTEEHPCQSVISIKLFCNFIEITFQHRSFPINMLFIFRTSFPENTSDRLLLEEFPRVGMHTSSLTSCIVLGASLDLHLDLHLHITNIYKDLHIKCFKKLFQDFYFIFVHFFLLWANIMQLWIILQMNPLSKL